MIYIIRERREIDDSHLLTDGFPRVEGFDFSRIDGQWRFTRAYIEES